MAGALDCDLPCELIGGAALLRLLILEILLRTGRKTDMLVLNMLPDNPV